MNTPRQNRHGTTADIKGWSTEQLAEFDRRWAEGYSIREMAEIFGMPMTWITRIRRRRNLPTRTPWRGGPKGLRREAVSD